MGNDEIDRLYQLSLEEFTPARNALAKSRGKEDPSIKQLQKPSVPAWAVNQLYWRERPVYDRLVKTAERLRDAHRKVLAGKPSDLREAESAHREAVKAALERTRGLLTGGGQSATPATMTAISETLEALPSGDSPGHLTRPLKPLGFEALSGVSMRAPNAPRAPLRIVERSPEQQKRDEAKAKEEERRRIKAEKEAEREAEQEKKRAEKELRTTAAALERAEAAVKQAEETLERLQKERSEALSAHRRAKLRVRE